MGAHYCSKQPVSCSDSLITLYSLSSQELKKSVPREVLSGSPFGATQEHVSSFSRQAVGRQQPDLVPSFLRRRRGCSLLTRESSALLFMLWSSSPSFSGVPRRTQDCLGALLTLDLLFQVWSASSGRASRSPSHSACSDTHFSHCSLTVKWQV